VMNESVTFLERKEGTKLPHVTKNSGTTKKIEKASIKISGALDNCS
jgi:hypothetical protein